MIGNGPGPETTALRSIGVRVNVGPVGTEDINLIQYICNLAFITNEFSGLNYPRYHLIQTSNRTFENRQLSYLRNLIRIFYSPEKVGGLCVI